MSLEGILSRQKEESLLSHPSLLGVLGSTFLTLILELDGISPDSLGIGGGKLRMSRDRCLTHSQSVGKIC